MKTIKSLFPRHDLPMVKGKVFYNIHYITGYNQCTLEDYLKMADALKKDFPSISDNSQITCSRITKSHNIFGFTIITVAKYFDPAEIEKAKKNGWEEQEKVDYYY